MTLKPLSIHLAAVVIVLQCQMALGVIEERGELLGQFAVSVRVSSFEESKHFGKDTR
jgi:hypothetical protein